MKNILLVGGGFDILHEDHRKFIKQGIKVFREKYGILEQVIITLIPDSKLNKGKGTQRPFFCYEWRKEDISNFLIEELGFETITDIGKYNAKLCLNIEHIDYPLFSQYNNG